MITFEAIDSLEKAEALRVLRNECAEWMTRDTGRISPERQREFYAQKIATGLVEGFLMLADGEPVAYGLLRPSGDSPTLLMSCGVATRCRDSGLGTLLVKMITAEARKRHCKVRLDVLSSNDRARHVYAKCGYHVIEANDDVVTMENSAKEL